MTWEHCGARILDMSNPRDRRMLAELEADPRIEFVDQWQQQAECARRLRPSLEIDTTTGPTHWAYYPWRRAVVALLDPHAFRRVRLDRNANMITADEQEHFGTLKIGVVGLSVGHVVAHTIAAEGLCGELRLADFDHLELTNLNRVPAGVLDLGVNKATLAARRIAELDPYLPVRVCTSGVTQNSIDGFLDGLDIVVEECDSRDMKVIVREAARAKGIPVLMASSDRGLVDIERFDREPQRPILHGLLGDVDTATLLSLDSRDKVPYVLRILDAAKLSSRGAASLVEVGQTLSTWPQLAGDVTLGAAAIAAAIRKIGMDEDLPSGRVRIDVSSDLDNLTEPMAPNVNDQSAPSDSLADPASDDVVERVTAAAVRAPSAGNAQPWRLEAQQDSVTIAVSPQHTSTLDIGFRASAVAVGAATYNAKVAAAACHRVGSVEFSDGDGEFPLRAVIRLAEGHEPDLARLYEPMLRRETNRRPGTPGTVDADTVDLLHRAAQQEGARLHLLSERDEIDAAADILAATDRMRYLTPHLHAEMIAELRWPGDPDADSGIDVRSLELDSGDLATLDILRRADVMAHLAQWNTGTALGEHTRKRVGASSALAVVTVEGQRLVDYARGGSAMEAVWIIAQQHGLAVQPVSPLFLYAHDQQELRKLSAPFAPSLQRLRHTFRELAGTREDESQVIMLKFCTAPPASVRSRRRMKEVRAK
ncbi:Rv1355c family protein [Mycobacterium hubeiense]|uniref:Rv1355c family protein n=1 Tax=Mycobacterium hubeiense TaxID=1867256 RepID=UPI002101726C|nr:Rv1355c family protein [Mycobacterium sp. QGD 101]